jgi:hypothetical protein
VTPLRYDPAVRKQSGVWALLREWGDQGLTRSEASALLRKHGFAPQTAGGWTRVDWIETRDDGRSYVTSESHRWLAERRGATMDELFGTRLATRGYEADQLGVEGSRLSFDELMDEALREADHGHSSPLSIGAILDRGQPARRVQNRRPTTRGGNPAARFHRTPGGGDSPADDRRSR